MTNFYVSKNGSDANSGTLRLPWLTIGESLSSLQEGDLLYVLEGIYEEAFAFTNTLRDDFSVWKKAFKVVAYPSHNVFLVSTITAESKSLVYYSLSGLAVSQDPAHYSGVSLVKLEYQDELLRPTVSALMYVVGGPDYIHTAPSDLTRPVVSITSPDNDENIYGTQEVIATSSDSVGIESMWINLDGKPVCYSYSSNTCTFTWDTTLSLNGPHTLEAFAKDTSGNIGTYYRTELFPNVDSPVGYPYITVLVNNIPSVAVVDEPLFRPSITVTCPQSIEKWVSGVDVNLTWFSVGVIGKLNIYLVRGGLSHQIFEKVPNTGTIPWTVFGARTPNCHIRVESVDNPLIFGLSEEFNIV